MRGVAVKANRLARLTEYAVSDLVLLKRELAGQGRDVIDLSVGDTDLPPPAVAVEALRDAVGDPRMSKYGFQTGLVEFREAVARYMRRRFGVTVDPMTELLPLLGSKEGLAHFPLAFADVGDVCVLPEPGYPPYLGGAVLADADVELFPLTADRKFLVELEDVPRRRIAKTKLVFLNYPNNPTTAVAPLEYLERTVDFCRRHGIVIAYDNPYCETVYDGYRAPSIMEIEGAREVAVEFHSFSKSFAMTGWRLGWAVGGSHLIATLAKLKTYVDTGPFLAVQQAGARVLDEAEGIIEGIMGKLTARRDAAVSAFRGAGSTLEPPRATMYVWAPVPGDLPSRDFGRRLAEEEAVIVVHGSAFGAGGEGYVRAALTVEPERLAEAGVRMARVVDRMGVPSA
jgi:LL-diaminopimelate aminotransferase